MFNSFFRSLLGADDPPTKVREVKSESYVSRPVCYRDDCMLLYGPKMPPGSKNSKEKYYEIIMYRNHADIHHMFSLFRSEEKEAAENKFITYKDRIPLFVQLTKECTEASLQRICDTLSEHQSWSVAHLAAHFGYSELFNNPNIQGLVNEVDTLTGATPLMVALKGGNIRMVQNLVSLQCSLDPVDLEGNNVFHYAASSNKDIIMILANNNAQGLNVYNKQGYTPLHVACLGDAPECVKTLISVGADVNLAASRMVNNAPTLQGNIAHLLESSSNQLYTQDMKNGGTPLHWSLSRAVIETLADKHCDINAVDFNGRTALHIMVLRGRLECAVALASNGAKISVADNDGNTPLHLAVKETSVTMVQALVVFGADLEAKNKKGFTPRHVVPVAMSSSYSDKILYILQAVGAKRCSESTPGCNAHCATRGTYNGVPPPPAPSAATRRAVDQMLDVATMLRAASLSDQNKVGRLLCLDGGGIRGLVLVQILIALEDTIGKPITHCFDWVAGTSTGGILALALASGKTIRECQQLYFKMKEHAFVGKRPYASEPLEEILKECFGTQTVMADIDNPKLMILALLADRQPVDLHIFRNYKAAKDILDDHNGTISPNGDSGDTTTVLPFAAPPSPAEQILWEVARATGAAPSYFKAFDRYLDGGLMGNNPTLDALTELAELRLALEATGQHDAAKKTYLKIVVSCGTGLIPVSRIKEVDLINAETLWGAAKSALGFSTIFNLLVDQAAQSNGRVVERARAWCNSMGVPYYRFCPQMSKDVGMDEKSDERLIVMLWETQAYMYLHRDRAKDVAALLTFQ